MIQGLCVGIMLEHYADLKRHFFAVHEASELQDSHLPITGLQQGGPSVLR